ncbi:hypothetical protein TWF506_006086 [Arthrobotrys conoides]|uniref:Uncharacterized protein n=1 Tax=Arthrobotrys conoides TaxID=74498 RepID=A0AAN8NBJ9_9PEZI
MQNLEYCDDIPGRLAQAVEDEQTIHYPENRTSSGHGAESFALCPHLDTPILLDDNELSFPQSYREYAANQTGLEPSGPFSNTDASAETRTKPSERHRGDSIPDTSCNQPLANAFSKLSLNLERVGRVNQFIDDDYHYYHPTYSPCILVEQRASWPLIVSAPAIFQEYSNRIEALDIAFGVSGDSVDSGVGLNECNTKVALSTRPGGALDLAYIGAWSYSQCSDT